MDKYIPHTTLKSYLSWITFIFLAAPYLIFFFGWLHWWVAVPMSIVCLLPIVWDWKRPRALPTQMQNGEEPGMAVWQIAVVCGVALFLILISGVGGFGWQTLDWEKHNMLLRDLIDQPWPVRYQFETGQLPLVYYFAYYLPAALIGKAFGWVAANIALLLESWLGLSLTLLWGFVLIKQSWWKAALLVGFFSGLDILGYLLFAPIAPMLLGFEMSIYELEWWSIGWIYPSFTHILFWAPNQGFVGWLVMSMILVEMFDNERKYTLWYLALTTFWSPFITLGLLPFVAADWISQPKALREWIRKYSLPNLCGVLLGGLISFMFLSKFYPLPPDVGGEIISTFYFALAADSSEVIFGLILLVLFWLFEGGLYGILAWKLLDPDDKLSRIVLSVALVWLAALPFYYYGYYNDLLQKSSIPALFALAIIVGRVVLRESKRRGVRLTLTVLIAIGFVTAFIDIGIQWEGILKNRTLWNLPASSEVYTLWQLQKKEQENDMGIERLQYKSFFSQYVGSNEAPFFQWFVQQ